MLILMWSVATQSCSVRNPTKRREAKKRCSHREKVVTTEANQRLESGLYMKYTKCGWKWGKWKRESNQREGKI